MRKTAEKIFGIEGYANRFLDVFFSLVVLNLLFLLTILPVVTLGPALSALYHSLHRLITKSDTKLCREYLRFLRKDFLRNLQLSGLLTGYGLMLHFDLQLFHHFVPAGGIYEISRIGFLTINVLLLLGLQHLPAYFTLLKLPLGQSVIRSMLGAFNQLPKVFLILILTVVPWLLVLGDLTFMPLLLLFSPSLAVYTELRVMCYSQSAEESD